MKTISIFVFCFVAVFADIAVARGVPLVGAIVARRGNAAVTRPLQTASRGNNKSANIVSVKNNNSSRDNAGAKSGFPSENSGSVSGADKKRYNAKISNTTNTARKSFGASENTDISDKQDF